MIWQSMESAPRDGSPVLLFYPEGRTDDNSDDFDFLPDWAVMRWDVEWGERAEPGADYCWCGYYSGTTPNGKPTLWAPIPDGSI